MSRLIVVDVAYDIVKECCKKVSPSSKVFDTLDKAIDRVGAALTAAFPMEAGVLIPRGPTLPPLPKGLGGGAGTSASPVSGQPVKIPVLPGVGTEVRPLTTRELALILSEFTAARQAVDEARQTADLCSALLGCVAKGFREKQLGASTGKRLKVIDRDFASHFAGFPKHVPKEKQHSKRP